MSLYVWIYICIYMCVCVFGQHFFINTYLNKQHRHPLSRHFFIYPFKLPYRFYGIRWALVNKPPMIN